MCRDCGCEQGNERAYFEHAHDHHHDHEVESRGHEHHHSHSHDHGPDHTVRVTAGDREIHIHLHVECGCGHEPNGKRPTIKAQTRTIVPLESRILAHNDAEAARNRSFFEARGVVAVNIISSPGSGKTYLLERTLEAIAGRIPTAVITGDQQTDNDAQRLAGKGAAVRQIETRSSCHLSAEQVGHLLEEIVPEGTKLLFIENVGNLVCPAAFDLGESVRVALLSVTEGEDKPLKYPVLFHDAQLTVLTKLDLVPHLDISLEKIRESVRTVRPSAEILEVSAKTGQGMDGWIAYLENLLRPAP